MIYKQILEWDEEGIHAKMRYRGEKKCKVPGGRSIFEYLRTINTTSITSMEYQGGKIVEVIMSERRARDRSF